MVFKKWNKYETSHIEADSECLKVSVCDDSDELAYFYDGPQDKVDVIVGILSTCSKEQLLNVLISSLEKVSGKSSGLVLTDEAYDGNVEYHFNDEHYVTVSETDWSDKDLEAESLMYLNLMRLRASKRRLVESEEVLE